MEFLSLSRKRPSARNVPSGEERGETDVFAGLVNSQTWGVNPNSGNRTTKLGPAIDSCRQYSLLWTDILQKNTVIGWSWCTSRQTVLQSKYNCLDVGMNCKDVKSSRIHRFSVPLPSSDLKISYAHMKGKVKDLSLNCRLTHLTIHHLRHPQQAHAWLFYDN